jgi:predicted AAA+ superfamily ATPase
MTFYPRWQTAAVREALKTRRVVVISGPRQCGKTTLSMQIVNDGGNVYRTLDDTAMLKIARMDPLGFLRHDTGAFIIDEVQKVPDLIPAIKRIVDEDNKNGQFLLTGSSDIFRRPDVTESLAGRVKHARLRVLSFGEQMNAQPLFLTNAFAGNFPPQIKGFDKREIIRMAFAGGYPEVLALMPEKRADWLLDYVESIIVRDLRDVANIRRQNSLRRLLDTFASWSGKLMDIQGVGGRLDLNRSTLNTYINVLESLYLLERLPAWTETDYQRAGQREKIFMTDTGLMAALLDWREEEVFWDADRSGKIIETMVFNELSAQVSLGRDYRLHHFRDREKREIDFLISGRRGDLLGIEVKAGSAVSSEDARHLKWFKNKLAEERPFAGVVLYAGENTLPLGEGITAVPMACLWS